jgi:hypothetical protein
MREIILTVMIILFVIGYFKIAFSLDIKKRSKILWLVLMTFMFGFSILLNFLFINTNDELTEKVKNKCPEYEKVENVYKLKER